MEESLPSVPAVREPATDDRKPRFVEFQWFHFEHEQLFWILKHPYSNRSSARIIATAKPRTRQLRVLYFLIADCTSETK